MRIYSIRPKDWDKQRCFGFFRYEPCKCGCTKTMGWGFNLFLVGFNIDKKEKGGDNNENRIKP